MQTNPAVEQNKNMRWSESLWNQSSSLLYECIVLWEACSGLQKDWLWAFSLAPVSSMSKEVRSSVIFLNQVECGHLGEREDSPELQCRMCST